MLSPSLKSHVPFTPNFGNAITKVAPRLVSTWYQWWYLCWRCTHQPFAPTFGKAITSIAPRLLSALYQCCYLHWNCTRRSPGFFLDIDGGNWHSTRLVGSQLRFDTSRLIKEKKWKQIVRKNPFLCHSNKHVLTKYSKPREFIKLFLCNN